MEQLYVTRNKVCTFEQVNHYYNYSKVYNKDTVPLDERVIEVSTLFGYRLSSGTIDKLATTFKERGGIPEGLYVETPALWSGGALNYIVGEVNFKEKLKEDAFYAPKNERGFGAAFSAFTSQWDHLKEVYSAFGDTVYATKSSNLTQVTASMCPVLTAFGAPESFYKESPQFRFTYYSSFGSLMYDFLVTHKELRAKLTSPFEVRLELFHPKQSSLVQGNICLYQDQKKKDIDRETSMKPGRAFRRMFPEATDVDVEQFVNLYNITFPIQVLEIKEGLKRKDFRHMYQGAQDSYQNVLYSPVRKSLADSCMRYDFGEHHPAEAYASGDFLALWTETPEGKIGSRTVVCLTDKSYGPIYGTTDYSISVLEAELKKRGITTCGEDDADWSEAKLLHIPHADGVVCPYIDYGYVPEEETSCGNYLTLRLSDDDRPTEGYYDLHCRNHTYCSCCEDRLHEDEVYSDDWGEVYCRYCYEERYTTCDETGDTIPVDEATEAYSMGFLGRLVTRVVGESALDQYYTYCVDGYWYHNDLVVGLYNGEYAYKNSDDLWKSDLTGEYYLHSEDKRFHEDDEEGDSGTEEEFLDQDYELVDGYFKKPEEKEERVA